jgi:hypothetical protein
VHRSRRAQHPGIGQALDFAVTAEEEFGVLCVKHGILRWTWRDESVWREKVGTSVSINAAGTICLSNREIPRHLTNYRS